jgi:hypothetical protein
MRAGSEAEREVAGSTGGSSRFDDSRVLEGAHDGSTPDSVSLAQRVRRWAIRGTRSGLATAQPMMLHATVSARPLPHRRPSTLAQLRRRRHGLRDHA